MWTITTCNIKSKGQQDVSQKEEAHLIRTPYAPLKEEKGPFAETSKLLYDVIHSCRNSSETNVTSRVHLCHRRKMANIRRCPCPQRGANRWSGAGGAADAR